MDLNPVGSIIIQSQVYGSEDIDFVSGSLNMAIPFKVTKNLSNIVSKFIIKKAITLLFTIKSSFPK